MVVWFGYEMDFLGWSLLAAFCLLAYFLVDKLILKRRKSLTGRFIRVLLFEQVGNDKSFVGVFKGVEVLDDTLGAFISIAKVKKFISGVSANDYFYDREFGKALLVCKYSDDDYRVMATLKGEEWFKRVFDEKTKKESFVVYDEPVGITQSAREVGRFNRSFAKRMVEKRHEKAAFWEKYGTFVMMGSMLVIILISTAYNSNKFEESAKHIAAVFDDKMGEAISAANSPQSVERLFEFFQRREVESETPPT